MHLRLKGAREACPEREELPARYFDICLEDGTRVGNCELRIGRNGIVAAEPFAAEKFCKLPELF